MPTFDFGGPLAVLRFLSRLVVIGALGALAGALLLAIAALVILPELPSIDALTTYHPAIPLRVYTADGTLIGQFGEERRALVKIEDVPPVLKHAILAAEDAHFYQHGAIDLRSVARAAFIDILGGSARQGASTITQQVARNLFLSRKKTLLRKFAEALLAYKMEHVLTKNQILQRYINQIFLGERAYGFAAAAQVYFGKTLGQLTLAQAATLAGLPKAPSYFDPHQNPKAATQRRAYVLGRMLALGYIDHVQYRKAMAEPMITVSPKLKYSVDARYAAEEVRQMMFQQYGEHAYTDGFSVYTTLRANEQRAADEGVRNGVIDYDRRHGYRGPEAKVALPGDAADALKAAEQALASRFAINDIEPAVVLHNGRRALEVITKTGAQVRLEGRERDFGRRRPRLRPGDLVRIGRFEGHWRLSQLPKAEAALVALNPDDGAVVALCGGFDFEVKQFDHVTQAYRQPGSSFKPFVYSAALEVGYSPATRVLDAPLVVPASYPGGKAWKPHNYEHNFFGPMSVREALAESRNVPAARVLLSIGIPYARDYVTRFGFPKDQVPPYPTMVLGVGSFTPLQMATAYAVFANGGYRVTPYLIARVINAHGQVIYRADPAKAGAGAPRVIDARNAFIMTNLLQSVVRRGTGARAQSLGRHDLAGKTGTTENFVDAWFDGYDAHRVAAAWIGFDHPHSLGRGETGARAALPMWETYMKVALKGVPDARYPVPPGVVLAPVPPAQPYVPASTQLPVPGSPESDVVTSTGDTPAPVFVPAPKPSPAPPGAKPVPGEVLDYYYAENAPNALGAPPTTAQQPAPGAAAAAASSAGTGAPATTTPAAVTPASAAPVTVTPVTVAPVTSQTPLPVRP